MTAFAANEAHASPMRKADDLHLFDYLYWVNGRLLEAASRLTPEQLAAPPQATTRALRATLVHELDVEWSWRLDLQGKLTDAEVDLDPEDYPDIAAIRAHWLRDELEMRAWLAAMTDVDIAAPVHSDLSAEDRPLWQYLLHIVFHATQQQADAATLLTEAGASPGEIGYLEWVRG
jgi:uncharacterized damage-inducible protein DinB